MSFKFDVTVLCELVEGKPCIWDKRDPNYKNKVVRERSWEEIYRFLDDEYDSKTSSEKKETGEKIVNKWTNIRDAFIRSLKAKSGQAAKKNYLYHEHLQFLLASQEPSETDSSLLVEESVEQFSNALDVEEAEEDSTSFLHSTNKLPKKRCRSKEVTDIEKEILVELKRPRLEKPSCTFFSSFEEYVSDMTENEKLKLHMDILNSISEMKASRPHAVPVYVYRKEDELM